MQQQRPLGAVTLLLIAVVCMFTLSCGAEPNTQATVTSTSPGGYPTPKPSATPPPTLTPAPTPRPTAAVIARQWGASQPITTALKEKARAACQSAQPAPQGIASLPKGTLPEASALAFTKNTWDAAAAWKDLDIPFLSAQQADGLRYLICVLESKTKSGTYKGGSSGATGWKVDWDVTMAEYPSGKAIASAHLEGDDPPYSVTTTKDTKDIYGMPPTDALRAMLLAISSGKLILADEYPIDAVAFSSDSKTLFTCSFNIGGTVREWNLQSAQQPRILMEMGADKCLGFSAGGKMLASYYTSSEDVVRFWDLSSQPARNLIEKRISHANSAAISPDGKIAAIGGDGEQSGAALYDTTAWQETAKLERPGNLASSLAFSSDGKSIAVGVFKNTVKIYDSATGKLLRAMDGKAEFSLKSVVFSPDGKLVAAADENNVKVWDTQTGFNVLTLGDQAQSVAFSADGKFLATGDMGGNVSLWDVVNGKYLRTLHGHTQLVSSLAFSPDGTKLASGSWDNTVAVWDISTK